MTKMPLTKHDESLVQATTDLIKKKFIKNQHHVACILETEKGIYASLHLDTYGFDICAEPIAISNALADGAADFRTLVAVYWNGDKAIEPVVVSPCGDCRQTLLQYTPGIKVVLLDNSTNALTAKYIEDLLPYAYKKL